jgi:hypothetical protein
MIVSSVHLVREENSNRFQELASLWLSELAKLPGWLTGSIARSVDEIDHWLITQHWADAGSCRRGLSNTELRPVAFELAQSSVSDISTFEPLMIAEKGEVKFFESIRTQDADTFSLSDNKLSDEI